MSTLAACNRQFMRYAIAESERLREPRAPVLFGKLPYIDNPLVRYWPQPVGLRDRVRIYETHALITESDWLALPRYDRSIPSGVYSGKVWRRSKWLAWFGPGRGATVRVCYLRALVVSNGELCS